MVSKSSSTSSPGFHIDSHMPISCLSLSHFNMGRGMQIASARARAQMCMHT
jgi:hypothetical protein